jgi:hypothetical protein
MYAPWGYGSNRYSSINRASVATATATQYMAVRPQYVAQQPRPTYYSPPPPPPQSRQPVMMPQYQPPKPELVRVRRVDNNNNTLPQYRLVRKDGKYFVESVSS